MKASEIPLELAVVIPVYNEGSHLKEVFEPWFKVLKELDISYCLLFLNDGSSDDTAAVLAEIEAEEGSSVQVINKANSGHGQTCLRGYELALEMNPEWVFQIDSDGQCDSSLFREFWEERGNSDCIFGVRETRDDGLSRSFVSFVLRSVGVLIGRVDGRDLNVPYRLMRGAVLRKILDEFYPRGVELVNVRLTLVFKKQAALRWRYVPIRFLERSGGECSLNWWKICVFGLVAVKEIFLFRKNCRRSG